jgi:beta propeller repeat protein
VKKLILAGIAFSVMTAGCAASAVKQPVLQTPSGGETQKQYVYDGWRGVLKGERLVLNRGKELNVIDLETGRELKTIILPASDAGFDIYGDIVVWSDLRNEGKSLNELGSIDKANADIFLYNLKTGEEKQLTSDSSSQVQPRIWKNFIVWMDNRSDPQKEYPSEWKIHLYNTDNGEEKVISGAQGTHTNPDIDDGKVVWEDGRNVKNKILRAGENVPDNNTDIYLYDIQTGEEMPVATGSKKEGHPRVSGNRVVWEDYNNGQYAADIHLYDLKTKETIRITNDKIRQSTPVIHGDYVAWMDERRGISTNDVIVNGKKPNSDIFLYDLKTGQEKLMTGDEPQILPQISEKWLVYETSRQVNPQIHAVRYR